MSQAQAPSEPAHVVHRVALTDRIEYAVFRAAFIFFAALPLTVALRVGACIGELLYVVAARARRVALFNLQLAFPEKSLAERRRILRASSRNLGRLGAEFCHLPRLTAEELPHLVTFADRPAWEHALERAGKTGMVILTGHFGNWELLAYAHGLLGHPITLVHRAMRNKVFNEAIRVVRSKAGTRAIEKRAAAKEALRVLKRHGILVVPADQNQVFSFGVFVDFFGLPACTTPGPARLAMLTGAPILPVFLVREGESGRHRVEILPDVEVASTGNREDDIRITTQRCTAVLEDMIRRYPEQWIWFHKRWKTRPPGEPRLYA